MVLHASKQCGRCGAEFVCNPGAITECQCSAIVLTTAERSSIASNYDDCLCIQCLRALKAEMNIAFKSEKLNEKFTLITKTLSNR